MRRRQRPNPKHVPELNPQDLEIALQLQAALESTADLPYGNRWHLALELLPESFLNYVVRARIRTDQDELLRFYGLLALVTIRELLDLEGEDPDPEVMMMTVLGVGASCLGELERRNKQFCDIVEICDNPFLFDPEEPVRFIPRDPEAFDREKLIEYYLDRAQRLA